MFYSKKTYFFEGIALISFPSLKNGLKYYLDIK